MSPGAGKATAAGGEALSLTLRGLRPKASDAVAAVDVSSAKGGMPGPGRVAGRVLPGKFRCLIGAPS